MRKPIQVCSVLLMMPFLNSCASRTILEAKGTGVVLQNPLVKGKPFDGKIFAPNAKGEMTPSELIDTPHGVVLVVPKENIVVPEVKPVEKKP